MMSCERNTHIFRFLLLFVVFLPKNVLLDTLNDAWMKTISSEISQDLSIIKNDEMACDFIQKIYTTFDYTSVVIDANKTINEIAQKLEEKIDDIFSALLRAKTAIENMQILDNTTKTLSALVPCISNVGNVTQNISKCVEPSNSQLNLDYILEKLRSKMSVMKKDVKQQYFISSSDLDLYSNNYPFLQCGQVDHMLLWKSFISRNSYTSRNIILLLDTGSSLRYHHLELVKSLAKNLIQVLNENDKMALYAISNDWSSPLLNNECISPNQISSFVADVPKLTAVNPTIKKSLLEFVDSLDVGNSLTNHVLGFEQALKTAQLVDSVSETVMIIYISRGLVTSLGEAKNVLETILHQSEDIDAQLVINTCTITDDGLSTRYNEQFMEDLALQAYSKYNISTTRYTKNGTTVAINSTEAIGFALSSIFLPYNVNSSYDVQKRISLPEWDANELTMSFTIGSLVDGHFGLLGMDIYFMAWAKDLLFFSNNYKNYYSFLMDVDGRVIVHPKFSINNPTKQNHQFVDIGHFENVSLFPVIKERLLTEAEGEHLATYFGSIVRWTWKRIGQWYILCIVSRESSTFKRPIHISWSYNNTDERSVRLVYQKLGNWREWKVCRHLNQVATLDTGSLYLSPYCFQTPSNLQDMQNEETVQNYMAFLYDNTHLLKNPGFKEEVKDEVAALALILQFLRSQHLYSHRSKYIVRRYVSSYNGVLEMFPGSILVDGLDPTKRPWFSRAIEHRSKLIMTPPYLDEGGAGYIVTIAHATPSVVVALDVTYGFIFRLLLKRMPFCLSVNITCFLIDDRGYLIYHPNLIDPNGHGPIERQHIVHKESLVANDILSHSFFIKKYMCNSYSSGTTQRYYKLNTSYTDILFNSVPGEHCVNYHIGAIQNTNLFVGMVNATCRAVATFCPCSIIDRLCLNCNRMEQKECECPCECPLEYSNCTESASLNTNPLCALPLEHVSFKAHFDERATQDMRSCFPATCAKEETYYKCLGVTGCEWCQYDTDGSVLDNPFCASLSTCFNGIVGSATPYNTLHETLREDESFDIPISVIIFFVFGVFVLLGMFFIYHRSSATPPTDRLYVSSTQDHLRMSDLNINDNYHAIGNHRDKLLQEEKPNPVSPYCVTGNYKRPTVAASSDHGYSTMTQHDESEHMFLAPVTLNSFEDDLVSDNIHNQNRKPCDNEAAPLTCLPKNKCIIVPVTVHRNMDTA